MVCVSHMVIRGHTHIQPHTRYFERFRRTRLQVRLIKKLKPQWRPNMGANEVFLSPSVSVTSL
jgi:hypothetical protein